MGPEEPGGLTRGREGGARWLSLEIDPTKQRAPDALEAARRATGMGGTMNLCTKLRELPPVVADGQQTLWCPDCEHYDRGSCDNPAGAGSSAPCPFDGQALPLREIAVNTGDNVPHTSRDGASWTELEGRPTAPALEQAIREAVARRTGARVRLHQVEATGGLVVIRGRAPRYYLKQLAIGAALEVVGSARPIRFDLNVGAAESLYQPAEAGTPSPTKGTP
jgi:hypothetical protein